MSIPRSLPTTNTNDFGEIIEKLTNIKKSVNEIAEAANNNPEKAKQEEISRALKF